VAQNTSTAVSIIQYVSLGLAAVEETRRTKRSSVYHRSALAYFGKLHASLTLQIGGVTFISSSIIFITFEITTSFASHTNVTRVGFRPFLFSRSGGQSYHRNNSVMSGNLVNNEGQLQNALTISTLGWNLAPLQSFTKLCHEFKLKNLTGTTMVYFAGGNAGPYSDAWNSVSKAKRKLDTIDMDEDVKSDIIRDAEYYYSEQS
jgi:hypothetical protein